MTCSRCRRPRPRRERDRSPRVGPPDATRSSRVAGPRPRSGCAGAGACAAPPSPSPDPLRPRPPRRRLFFGASASARPSPAARSGVAAAAPWSGWASSRWVAGDWSGAGVGDPVRPPWRPLLRPLWRRRGPVPSLPSSDGGTCAGSSGASTDDSSAAGPDADPSVPRPRRPRPRPPRRRRRPVGGLVDASSAPCAPSTFPSSGPSGVGAFCLGADFSPTGTRRRGPGSSAPSSSGARSGARVAGSPEG
jgi:hypothetical protein